MKKYFVEINDNRADALESTIVAIANAIYRKKDALGLPMSQKELDEVITMIDRSPVFKRLVEQTVRDWIRRQDRNGLNLK